MQFTRILLFAVVLTISGQSCRASFWDSVPIISQAKSLFQVATGDAEGAKKTQENFVDTAPVISQAKSAVQSASGDNEGAKKTQEKFAHNLEQVVDATPVLGHIKGGIHVAAGDKEHGLDIIKGASTSTGSLIGGLLGGPAGAVLGGIATDGLITGIDSAANKQFRPFGTVDFLANIKDQSSGDIFDQILGTGLDLAGGGIAKNKGKPKKPTDNPDSPNRGFGMDPDFVRGQIDEANVLRPDDMRIDVDSPAFLDTARHNTGLPPEVASRLEQIDFRDVNDIDGNMNCYFCTAAAFKNTFATDLVQKYGIMMDQSGAPTVHHIVELFKEVGFPDTRLIFEGDLASIRTFLDNNVAPGQTSSFALAFTRLDNTGHVILMRVWRDQNGVGHVLTTDFQVPVNHAKRFATDFPPNVKKFFLIQPQTLISASELEINNLIDGMNGLSLGMLSDSGQKSCANKRVIGYLASWSSRRFTVEQSLHLTNVIYAFISMDAEGGLTIPTPTSAKQRLLDAMVAKQAHLAKGLDLKVSFAVGGWENSQYFSSVIGDAGKRSKLIAAIATIIRDFKFDGVDIDWEYPVKGGATKGVDSDKQNYVKFLNELRYALGNEYLISIAGAAGQEALEGFDLENIVKVVDWIGVMSYDLNGAWDSEWGAFVGPNAPLYHGAPLGYSGKLNANWALKHYVCNSKDPNKIVMGIPFYGRYWSKTVEGKDPSHPLYRKAEMVNGKYGGDKSYNELIITWLSSGSGFDKKWDDKTKTPWAIHPENNLVLTYDDAKSIKMKVDYAIEHNLGGVMIWSIEQDDDQLSLMKTISSNACRQTGNSINYKCSPIREKRWWTWVEDKDKAGMCGKGAPLYKGFYPLCDPDDPGYSCCSKEGYCGSGPKFCDCKGCVDYEKNPEKLIAEPIKPSRPVQWHVGFDTVKAGQPRCGVHAKPLDNGYYAICNPDDENAPCCSKWGYCGSEKESCECSGCKDYRKISVADSMKRVRRPEEIQWHVGNDVVKQGEPRCGPSALKINGKMAICDPEDDGGHCCSKWGFCGTGDDFCKCDGCHNSRST